MIKSLAYLGVNSPRAEEWRRYGTGFVGAELAPDGPGGAVRLRLDDADWRLEIRPAEEDSVEFIGWQVDREEDLELVAEALAKAGVTAERGSKELAQERHVNQLITFTDPWGFPHEVIWGQHFAPATFRPGRASGGFVTGEQGLGHILLLLPDIEAGHEFFTAGFGFVLSDKIIVPDGLNSRFYHANKRHHTFALAESSDPGVAGLHHLMLQVKEMDDVGKAYDLLEEFEVPLTSSLGRHTNDMTFSFYSTTPSLFHIEIGYGGIEVDEAWVPRVFTKTAIWGHKRHPEAKNRPLGMLHDLPK